MPRVIVSKPARFGYVLVDLKSHYIVKYITINDDLKMCKINHFRKKQAFFFLLVMSGCPASYIPVTL